jgi:hypothetical protein
VSYSARQKLLARHADEANRVFAQDQRLRDTAAEEREAIAEKTARLRELRLAKEAEERAARQKYKKPK